MNWQWLPFVSIRESKTTVQFILNLGETFTSVSSKEEILSFVKERGYSLSSLSNLGITEVSLGCYLYKGRIYKRESRKPIKVLQSLLSLISGKTIQTIKVRTKGVGVLSKEHIERLVSKKGSIEFRGEVYNSYSDIAKRFDISTSYLSVRLAKGQSLEEIISNYSGKRVRTSKPKVVDHLGNKFISVKEMLRHWGISRSAYERRKNLGWSLEEALTIPVNGVKVKTDCVDSEGKRNKNSKL